MNEEGKETQRLVHSLNLQRDTEPCSHRIFSQGPPMVSNGRRVIEQQQMLIVDHDWHDGDKRKKSRSSEADPDISTHNRDPWHLCTDSMSAPIVSPFR